MGDQRINKSAAWNPQYSAWNPPSKGERSQLNPHPFVIQPKKHSNKRQSSAEEENQAFQRHQAEAQMLQLKEKYGVVTPLEQARLDVLQAKMQEFGAQRLAEIKAQPDLLDVLIRNPQMAQSPKPLVPGQAKLSIGCPTDLYEQEADHAASQVVEQINAPQSGVVQRTELPDKDDELQMKAISPIQRVEMPDEDDELQMKAISPIQRVETPDEDEEVQMKPMVQRRADGGEDASEDVESEINRARGSRQALDPSFQAQMGKAMGADFGGLRVQTDAQLDQLNQSLQAKAFTTGQDVFFRQGPYEPGSRGGQELIAHELPHVVQQNGWAVAGNNIQRKPPRRTEERILGEMAAGNGSLTPANSRDLIKKMGKDQTNSRARAIAARTEAESEQLVSELPQQEQTNVRNAIRDYVASSMAIQTDARNNPNAPNQAVQALDAALAAIQQQLNVNNASNERIVYRSISYASGVDIPYGQRNQAGNIINIGDYVGDRGFLSTSEHRQFVLGKEQTGQVQGLLKLAIHGTSGVPIAIDIPLLAYSNTNQQALYDQQQDKANGR